MASSPTTTSGTTRTARGTATVLAVILLAYCMILLDNSVIFTALPSLQRDLALTPAELTWVQDAYTLVFGGLLLLGARAGDLLGRRRVFVAGLAVFTIASLLIGLAPDAATIIAARALQGVGAAIVAPTSLALLTASFAEGPERSRALALYSATAGIGASLGLLVGGAAATWWSWRAGFFLNVPHGAALLLLAVRAIPAEAAPRAGRGGFDLAGALAATLGTGALVLGIIRSAEAGWADAGTIAALAAAAALLGLLVLVEARAAQPIIPLRLFASRVRAGAYLARFAYLGAMLAFFSFLTRWMQEGLGFTPLEAGIGFLPMTAVNFAVALAVPPLARRIGETAPLVAGVALTLAGMLWLALLGPTAGYLWGIAAPMVLVGAGQGLAFGPLTAASVRGAAPADAGAASGLVNTVHQLGMAVGLGIAVAVAHRVAASGAGLAAQVSAALGSGSAMLALSLAAVLGLIVPAVLAARRAR